MGKKAANFGFSLWFCVAAGPGSLCARAYLERKDGDNHKALGFSSLSQGLLPGHCRGRKGEEAGGGTRIFTQNRTIS